MAQVAKIMLVEDDNNLGEIYEARMQAEGYTVVVAHDGEEALAMAAKEKPDLIISDVMMPKISGFEMLDILRNTPGLRSTKVIMLTALGQAEDKTRADSLGADRYLVKSQVTLEDIVENARALLGDDGATPATLTISPVPSQIPTATPAPTAPAPQPIPAPAQPDAVAPTPVVTPPVTQPPAVSSIPVAAPPAGLSQPGIPPAAEPTPAAVPITDLTTAATPTQPITPAATSLAEPLSVPLTEPVPTQPAPQPPTDQGIPAFTPPPEIPPSTPVAAPPASAQNPNDKLISGAVDELLANTPQPTPVAASPVASPTPAPAQQPLTAPAPQLEASQQSELGANNKAPGDNTPQVAHEKVIKPINTDFDKKPDLNSLLAAEEKKESLPQAASITGVSNGIQSTVVMPSSPAGADEPTSPTTGQPGNVVTPSASTQNTSGNGIDPGNIAL